MFCLSAKITTSSLQSQGTHLQLNKPSASFSHSNLSSSVESYVGDFDFFFLAVQKVTHTLCHKKVLYFSPSLTNSVSFWISYYSSSRCLLISMVHGTEGATLFAFLFPILPTKVKLWKRLSNKRKFMQEIFKLQNCKFLCVFRPCCSTDVVDFAKYIIRLEINCYMVYIQLHLIDWK